MAGNDKSDVLKKVLRIIWIILSVFFRIVEVIFGFVFALILVLLNVEPPKRRRHGKCDGDCSKCPPHYGYRYGRWYYGHGHSEGCQLGGNKCDGGCD